jgi:TRAP-type C4-dicarboxylate transport system permease small subunit
MNFIKKALDRLNSIFEFLEKVICGSIIVLLVVVVTIGIVARYVLNSPLSWTNDLSLFMYVWLSFLAASLVLRKNGHYKIEILVEKFPLKAQRALEVLSNIGILVFLWIFIAASFRVFPRQMNMQETVSLNISKAWHTASITAGFVLIGIQIITNMLGRLIKTPQAKSGTGGNV